MKPPTIEVNREWLERLIDLNDRMNDEPMKYQAYLRGYIDSAKRMLA